MRPKCLCWPPDQRDIRDGEVFIVDCNYLNPVSCQTSCKWYCDPRTLEWVQQSTCPNNCECEPPGKPCDCDNIGEILFTPCYGYVRPTTTTTTTTTRPPRVNCGGCAWYCTCRRSGNEIVWYWLQTRQCANPDACDCPAPTRECNVDNATETEQKDCLLSDEWLIISRPSGPCGICKYKRADRYQYVLDEYSCRFGCDCPRSVSGIRIRNQFFWIVCDLDGGIFSFSKDQSYQIHGGIFWAIAPAFVVDPIIIEPVIEPGTFQLSEIRGSSEQTYQIRGGIFPEPAIKEFEGFVEATYGITTVSETISVSNTFEFWYEDRFNIESEFLLVEPEDIIFDFTFSQEHQIDGGEITIYDPCKDGLCLFVWYDGKWYLVESLCPCDCFPPESPGSYDAELKRGKCKTIAPRRLDLYYEQTYYTEGGEIIETPIAISSGTAESNYITTGGAIEEEEPPRCYGWCIYFWNGSEWILQGALCSCDCYPPTESGSRYGELKYGECR